MRNHIFDLLLLLDFLIANRFVGAGKIEAPRA